MISAKYSSDLIVDALSLPVCETTWNDVFDAGIGSQRTQSDREEPRVPSAYLLVYINADQKALSRGTKSRLQTDIDSLLCRSAIVRISG